jgi:hypothetical protein
MELDALVDTGGDDAASAGRRRGRGLPLAGKIIITLANEKRLELPPGVAVADPRR